VSCATPAFGRSIRRAEARSSLAPRLGPGPLAFDRSPLCVPRALSALQVSHYIPRPLPSACSVLGNCACAGVSPWPQHPLAVLRNRAREPGIEDLGRSPVCSTWNRWKARVEDTPYRERLGGAFIDGGRLRRDAHVPRGTSSQAPRSRRVEPPNQASPKSYHRPDGRLPRPCESCRAALYRPATRRESGPDSRRQSLCAGRRPASADQGRPSCRRPPNASLSPARTWVSRVLKRGHRVAESPALARLCP